VVGEDDAGHALMLAHIRNVDKELVEHVDGTVFPNEAHTGHDGEAIFLNEKVFTSGRPRTPGTSTLVQAVT
jgi:hypothetical protein